jgi:hypothetical protein
VYDDSMPTAEELAGIGITTEAARTARSDLRIRRQVAEGWARLNLLGGPDGKAFREGESGVPVLDDLAPMPGLDRESDVGAQTRLAVPSARVVVVDGGIDELRDGAVLRRAARVPDDLTRWLLKHSVSISHWALVAHVASASLVEQPPSFAKTPALRDQVLLRTVNGAYEWTANGRAHRLSIDEELGVVIEEVDGG